MSHNPKDKTVENIEHGKHNISDRSICHQKQLDQVHGLRGRNLQQTATATRCCEGCSTMDGQMAKDALCPHADVLVRKEATGSP